MKKQKILSILLYLLPILFFIVSYFLITTSGEDIWQGAGNFRTGAPIDVVSDAKNAFTFNSRITDMYAWSVIDFYDYQFQFGPDFIFRIVDVIAAVTTFYLATYIILGHKPKLLVKDSLTFCACFTAVIITPFGRPFYNEFSMIHNYVPLALSTLLFSIPYLNLIRKNPPKKHLKLLTISMLFLGFYFGTAATITPIAFLVTVAIYCLIRRKKLTKPPIWFFTGLAGTILGFIVCWAVGSGVDHYTSSSAAANFDYVSIGTIFSEPFSSIPKIIFHEIYNFGITLAPLIVFIVAAICFTKNRRRFITTKFYKNLPSPTKNYLLVFALFIIIHLLGATLVKAPPRLIIPSYLAGVIIIIRFFAPYIQSKVFDSIIAIATAFILVSHTTLLVIYHHSMSNLLSEIQTSTKPSLCIEQSQVSPPIIKFINLSQADMLVKWATPVQVYDKQITFCE